MEQRDPAWLSRLLLAHWDVLGVADSDVGPESEYLHEATELHRVLQDGGSAADAADLLARAARGLGALVDPQRDTRVGLLVWSAYNAG